MKSEKLSIIVVNWNKKNYLRKCLKSINEKTIYPNYEIIVVDNGSKDGSVAMIKNEFPEVKLIANKKNMGFAKANNQGITYAINTESNYLFLLNNDTEIIDKNWLNELINFSKSDEKIGVVGCKLIYPNGDIQFAGAYVNSAGIGKHITSDIKNPVKVDYVTGAAMLIKKIVINDIGLLDEGYFPIYFEETDFCYRARKAGYKIMVNPSVKIRHFESATMKEDPGTYYILNKNRVRFMLFNFSKMQLLKAIPWEILRFIKNIFKLKTHLLLKAYTTNIKNLKEILEKRKGRNL